MSGASISARATLRNTVRTRAASRGPCTSIAAMILSDSASNSGEPVTTSALLDGSAVTTGFRNFGSALLLASSACCTLSATSAADACTSEYTRVSVVTPSWRGASSCAMISFAIGISVVGAVMMTRMLSESATTRGSATGSPAFTIALSACGQRVRSLNIGCSAATMVSGAMNRTGTTRISLLGAANASASRLVRMPRARSASSFEPTMRIVALPAGTLNSTLSAPLETLVRSSTRVTCSAN